MGRRGRHERSEEGLGDGIVENGVIRSMGRRAIQLVIQRGRRRELMGAARTARTSVPLVTDLSAVRMTSATASG
jgi:hypothetical protein